MFIISSCEVLKFFQWLEQTSVVEVHADPRPRIKRPTYVALQLVVSSRAVNDNCSS